MVIEDIYSHHIIWRIVFPRLNLEPTNVGNKCDQREGEVVTKLNDEEC